MIYSLNRDKQSGIQIRDDGIDQGARGQASVYNFTGSGVIASVSGDVATINITGGGGGGSGAFSLDDGSSSSSGVFSFDDGGA
jgi:hypothetical protein